MTGAQSHMRAVTASRGHLLYRVDGMTAGHSVWAYVLVDKGKLSAFKKAMEKGAVKPPEYGRVLAWGMDDEPGDDVWKAIYAQYGVEVVA